MPPLIWEKVGANYEDPIKRFESLNLYYSIKPKGTGQLRNITNQLAGVFK
tara:strand:+ start:738 stop:887 length:150 start_codon:yes stop_codon:yes gene_type:complete